MGEPLPYIILICLEILSCLVIGLTEKVENIF